MSTRPMVIQIRLQKKRLDKMKNRKLSNIPVKTYVAQYVHLKDQQLQEDHTAQGNSI